MAISMVRKPSETPNIINIDDIIPFRYAYGDQSGYVIGRGAEVSHTVNGNQFTINSGRLVVQGVESDIDANGVTLTIDSVSETRYYVVYHEINLATNTANIKVQFDTATYPNVSVGDDLTANSSGTSRLPLYRFTALSGVINNVEKVVKAIEYSPKFYKDENGVLKVGDIIIPQKKPLNKNEFVFGWSSVDIPLGIDCSKDVKIKFDIAFEIGTYDFGDAGMIKMYTENLITCEMIIRNNVQTNNNCLTYYRNFESEEGDVTSEICFGTFTSLCSNNTLSLYHLVIFTNGISGVDQSRTAKITNIYQILE